METESFLRGLEKLEEVGRIKRTAFLCSERFSWECHRRWISDQLIQRGWKGIHIVEKGEYGFPIKGKQIWRRRQVKYAKEMEELFLVQLSHSKRRGWKKFD